MVQVQWLAAETHCAAGLIQNDILAVSSRCHRS